MKPSKAPGVKAYYKYFSDAKVIEIVVDIIGDILNKRFPDDSPMGLYNVGDVRATKGFWASDVMLEELTQGFIGRAIRNLCINLHVDLEHPSQKDHTWIAFLLEDTNAQAKRVVPKIKEKALAKYGTPTEIDEARIADLSSRAYRFLHGHNA